MLFKLAFRNVKRQISNYLIYFITVTLTVALIFSFNNLTFSKNMENLADVDQHVRNILTCVSFLMSIVVAFVISYATAFLVRRRKQEFGLYLTLGMTRGNILALFMGETLVTFLFSLGAGVLFGLGLYQAFMAAVLNFLEAEIKFSGYSVFGSLITVAMVVVMFLIASVASLGYLRFAKISRLLKGDKAVEKTVKRPVIWLAVAVVAVGILAGSIIWFSKWLHYDDFYERITEIEAIIILFVISLILLPLSVSKSIVPVCVKRNEKKLNAKGTAVFTMRQLSGRLNSNSIMAGVLTFLLVFAIIAPNVFLLQTSSVAADAKYYQPYDIKFRMNLTDEVRNEEQEYEPYDYSDFLPIISKYSRIKETSSYVSYYIPYNVDIGLPEEFRFSFEIITESSYNKLRTMLGAQPVQLHGGYYVAYSESYAERHPVDFSDIKITLGGKTYTNDGFEIVSDDDAIEGVFRFRYSGEHNALVIPDGVERAEELKLDSYEFIVVNLENTRYDARKLRNELWTKIGGFSNGDVELQEYLRLSDISNIALWLISCMFIAFTFVLLSMAMLALKMLSMLLEDKHRYKTLWRLGADDGMISKSLFSQMFFYFFTPLALPILLIGPLCSMLLKFIKLEGRTLSVLSVLGQILTVMGIFVALFALYFTVTYLIARRDLKKSLRSN